MNRYRPTKPLKVRTHFRRASEPWRQARAYWLRLELLNLEDEKHRLQKRIDAAQTRLRELEDFEPVNYTYIATVQGPGGPISIYRSPASFIVR